MKRKRDLLVYIILFAICTAVMGYSLVRLEGRNYYFVSVAILLCGIILFLFRFENRSPSAEELTLIAVMCALAVVSRISLAFLPQVKPMAAFVIMAGISLGAETGFITGAMSAFVSNFYFGQGPYTPFQMFALGLVGFFAGILFQKLPVNKAFLSIYGLVSILVLYGGVVDLNTLFFTTGNPTWEAVAAVYGAGFSMNLIYGISTACFLILLHRPVLNRLERVKIKYGLIQKEGE